MMGGGAMTRFTVAHEITKTAAAKTPIAVIVRLFVDFNCFTIYLSNKRLPFATQTRPDMSGRVMLLTGDRTSVLNLNLGTYSGTYS